MRVVLNGWFLAHHPHTGSAQYLRGLLAWLPRVAPQHAYTVVVPAGAGAPGAEPLPAGSPVTVVRLPASSSNWGKLRFEQQTFPAACRAQGADLAHVPYWAPPLRSPVPFVVTVHDLIPLRLPPYRGGLAARMYTALAAAGLRGAALVLADSEASAADLRQHLGLGRPGEAGRVRVVYLAAGPEYGPEGDWQVDDPIRARYGLEEGYVLYLGGFDARKNVRALLTAWTWAAGSIGASTPLVIAGQLPAPRPPMFEDVRAIAGELEVADTVRFIGPVAEADKPAIYRGAAVFAYPSRYEGFGLPPLEAMACGVPVVASSASSLPEVIGAAGYLIPPDDTRAFGAALITVVVEPRVADDLRARGLEQARRFSWEQTARETVEAYEAAITQSNRSTKAHEGTRRG